MMLNEVDPAKREYMTTKWLRNMDRHLNITIITASQFHALTPSLYTILYFPFIYIYIYIHNSSTSEKLVNE